MQTTIIYNGVTIKNVLTDDIVITPVKESTGVDQLGVRVVVQCTGIVHTSQADTTQIGVKLATMAGLGELLASLSKDRRPFLMRIGQSVVFDVKPGAVEPNAPKGSVTIDLDKMDIDNGPRPHVEVLGITSGHSATIRFTVEFVIPNCGGPGNGPQGSDNNGDPINLTGLVSFRFWIYEDIDCMTWLTSRTYVGRIRVAHKGISAQALARIVVVPPIQRGFQRRVVQLHESENGLELDFTIQDQEMIAAPPWNKTTNQGATSWSGSFQMSTEYFARSVLELNFRLTGPKGTTKTTLAKIGLNVISAKTKLLELLRPGNPNGSSFLETFSIREELAENTVEFFVRIRHTGQTQQLIGLFSPGGDFGIGKPLGDLGIGYDPEVAFAPGASATLTGLFLSTLQTPCSPATMPQLQDKPPKKEKPPKRGPQESNPDTWRSPESKTAPVSKSHLEAMYLECLIDSDLHITSGQIALATGVSSAAANRSSGRRKAAPRMDTQAIVSLHQPTANREIRINASRVDLPPQLPKPNKTFQDQNGITHWAIGEAVISSSIPQLSADLRKMLYTVAAQYHYAMSRVPGDSESIPVGALPYRVSNYADPSRRLPANIFVSPKEMLS